MIEPTEAGRKLAIMDTEVSKTRLAWAFIFPVKPAVSNNQSEYRNDWVPENRNQRVEEGS
jgi:hypothetical protein